MGRKCARGRLMWAVGTAAVLALTGAGLLLATDHFGTAAAQTLGEQGEAEAYSDLELREVPSQLTESGAGGGIAMVAPAPDSRLRGETLVRANWENRSGFVVFRVDDQFAFATSHPYEMRWDTSTAKDGPHTVGGDAYDDSGRYQGTSSIQVVVANAIATPPDGVLLTVRFGEDDLLTRQITARGELSALTADEELPQGFDVLAADLQCDVNQTVLDPFYEGVSALIRNRLRKGSLTVGGVDVPMSDVGRYAMVQVSQNGIAIPATASATRPRLGLGEICLALQDYPVLPGDTWQAPLGVVADLYTRKAVFVQAQHTFEGLRWFRGQECAVVRSTYRIPQLLLFEASSGQVAATQAAGAARAAAGPQLTRARLADLEGKRTTYLSRNTGKILRTEDTVYGRAEFRASTPQAAAAPRSPAQAAAGGLRGPGAAGGLRGAGGAGGLRGPGAAGGLRGGMPGSGVQGGLRGGLAGSGVQGGLRGPGAAGGLRGQAAGGQVGQAGAARAGAQAAPKQVPARLTYALTLVSDLVNP